MRKYVFKEQFCNKRGGFCKRSCLSEVLFSSIFYPPVFIKICSQLSHQINSDCAVSSLFPPHFTKNSCQKIYEKNLKLKVDMNKLGGGGKKRKKSEQVVKIFKKKSKKWNRKSNKKLKQISVLGFFLFLRRIHKVLLCSFFYFVIFFRCSYITDERGNISCLRVYL